MDSIRKTMSVAQEVRRKLKDISIRLREIEDILHKHKFDTQSSPVDDCVCFCLCGQDCSSEILVAAESIHSNGCGTTGGTNGQLRTETRRNNKICEKSATRSGKTTAVSGPKKTPKRHNGVGNDFELFRDPRNNSFDSKRNASRVQNCDLNQFKSKINDIRQKFMTFFNEINLNGEQNTGHGM